LWRNRLRDRQAALLQAQDAVAGGGEAGVVGGDDRGQAVRGVHRAQQGVQRVGGVFVQVARRLVRQQQRGVHDERAGDGDTLLLAS
jgi:hypothetical protein